MLVITNNKQISNPITAVNSVHISFEFAINVGTALECLEKNK